MIIHSQTILACVKHTSQRSSNMSAAEQLFSRVLKTETVFVQGYNSQNIYDKELTD